jgi:FixJ family two-component response regulator
VLDVRLPGRSGLEFQRDLAAANRDLPIIFITGHGDIPMTVQAMKGGAIEFLTKPFRDQDPLDAIEVGQREIMVQVTQGRLCKQIAGDIGLAEGTVKVHRSRLMRKMKARSLPELSRMADKLMIAPESR